MKLPNMNPVISSNVLAIGHDGTFLYARFKSGDVWRYECPKSCLDAALNAKSVGSYINKEIKPHCVGEKVPECPFPDRLLP